jgi:hypothetical protein
MARSWLPCTVQIMARSWLLPCVTCRIYRHVVWWYIGKPAREFSTGSDSTTHIYSFVNYSLVEVTTISTRSAGDQMSKILSPILIKCLKSSHLCWWNVYAVETQSSHLCSTTLASILLKCLNPSHLCYPLMYSDEMGTTLLSMLINCQKFSRQDHSMRNLCETPLLP